MPIDSTVVRSSDHAQSSIAPGFCFKHLSGQVSVVHIYVDDMGATYKVFRKKAQKVFRRTSEDALLREPMAKRIAVARFQPMVKCG